ncbi:MAG: hypothetical protein ETSY1_28235 [Candidatus Entotheonella factor]|uniref:Uncharacterized protein n=1 Tax=Entotheonella factor TaxID=1429438 RepID=W4LDF7_ENTF1|nr:MAG: hypothetical protein ETSY1_28235 [Candidatus Entotheonella factor]
MKQQIKAYTARYRFLSQATTSVYGWILQLKYIAQNPLASLRYRTHFHIIAGPGFLGFKGGLFNPGTVTMEHGDTVLLAKGQTQHWIRAQGDNVHDYLIGAPVFMSLDTHHHIKESDVVQNLHDFPEQDELELEDFRLFRFEDKIWVNHNIIRVQRTAHQTGYTASMVSLSQFDPDHKSLTFQGYPQLDFDVQKKEKNWVFADFNGELYLFYSFHPYRVLKLIDRQTLVFSTIIDQPLDPQLSDIGGYGTFVSYSTNPVDYDEQHWLLLIHQVDPQGMGRLYYHWGVLIDKATMYPVKITAAPLFSGLGARGLLKGVIYVMSVIAQQNEFIFYCGEGDTYLSRTKISKDKLDSLWMNVQVKRPDPVAQLV